MLSVNPQTFLMAYVYTHIRMDTNQVFYVGIGSKPNRFRAFEKSKRNKHWRSIVSKTDFKVEIIADNITWENACNKEMELIQFYGRADKKNGTLCNWTDGGEGAKGAIVSGETKKKISAGKIGKKRPPITPETRERLSNAMKGKMPKNFSYLHSPEIVRRRIIAQKGSQTKETIKKRIAKWTGANNPRSVKIIDDSTGVVYDTLKDAWLASGLSISRSFFSLMMLGVRTNKTTFKYLHKLVTQ